MTDLFYKLLIIRTPGIGAARYNDLVARFGSVRDAANGLGADDALRDKVLREMDRAAELNIQYITDDDARYPVALKRVKNHPPVLTVRGNVATLARGAVAMVGTRHATATGMNFMSDLAKSFADHDIAVVSGMAMGTDAAAHRGALRATGNTNTIAVLAGGVDYIWPLENESLYWEIIERGCVISEMPVGFKPVASNFIMRNRIVAGLADPLILGEADKKSGSMTTARFANEMGRTLWAVPSHPADSRGAGPNSLIAAGLAKLCQGIDDFFATDGKKSHARKISEKSQSELNLIDALGTIPVSESVLTQVVKKSVSEIKSELVVLELRGLVRKVDGGYVRV